MPTPKYRSPRPKDPKGSLLDRDPDADRVGIWVRSWKVVCPVCTAAEGVACFSKKLPGYDVHEERIWLYMYGPKWKKRR